jgi:hypothetical protein
MPFRSCHTIDNVQHHQNLTTVTISAASRLSKRPACSNDHIRLRIAIATWQAQAEAHELPLTPTFCGVGLEHSACSHTHNTRLIPLPLERASDRVSRQEFWTCGDTALHCRRDIFTPQPGLSGQAVSILHKQGGTHTCYA